MLKEILQLIDNGEVASFKELAEKLDTEESALEGSIATLIEKGYLSIEKTDSNVKSGNCLMCSSREFCGADVTGKAYTLTDKGKHYLEE